MFLIFDFCFVQVTIALSVYINIVQIVIVLKLLSVLYFYTFAGKVKQVSKFCSKKLLCYRILSK